MITVAFVNQKGGVGKTTLVSHLAWMFAERGVATLAVDLDHQASLTATMLGEQALDSLVHENQTIASDLQRALRQRTGSPGGSIRVSERLHLMGGDIRLLEVESVLESAWADATRGEPEAIRETSALRQVIDTSARRVGSRLVLVDLPPNLGPTARAALVTCDQIVVPVARGRFGYMELSLLGDRLQSFHSAWQRAGEFRGGRPASSRTPKMNVTGYVVVDSGASWAPERDGAPDRLDHEWRDSGLAAMMRHDPSRACLGVVRRYPSLWSMAAEVHKPMFLLKSADGARGAHLDAVRACYEDFLALARRIAAEVGIQVALRTEP